MTTTSETAVETTLTSSTPSANPPLEAGPSSATETSAPVVEAPSKGPEFQLTPGLPCYFLEDRVLIEGANGKSRNVSYPDFVEFFLRLHGKLQEEASSQKAIRLLPPNVYAIEETRTALRFGMYFPETVRNVTFLENTTKRVIPNVIITITLDKKDKEAYTFRQGAFLCTSLPFAMLPKRIFLGREISQKVALLPFSNVYDDAQLCFGRNAFPSKFENEDFRMISQFHEVLWASPFNYDLGVKALNHGPSEAQNFNTDRWYAHLATLAEQGQPFPYHLLGI